MGSMSDSEYFIGTREIQELRGRSFEVQSRVLGRKVEIRISNDDVGEPLGPRRGAEAIGLCAECLHPDGDVSSFLKIFMANVPERVQRNRFLMELGLSGRHWMFSAMPYGVLPLEPINSIEVVAHLSRRVGDGNGGIAPNLARLMTEEPWRRSPAERRRFAGQIACAIHALEAIDLVHGDISLRNVLLGWDEQDGEVAVLCDYDGFHHPLQPPLPLRTGRVSVRKAGTPGFQSPCLLEEIASGKNDAQVRTDRFALGVLLCQILVWQPAMADRLGRDELLSNDMVRGRTLSELPSDVTSAWAAGFDLLRQALEAPGPEHMPSPRAWLEAVGGPPVAPPRIALRNPRMNEGNETVVQLVSPSGDFRKVAPQLSEVRFRRLSGSVQLEFLWSDPVELREVGGGRTRVTGPARLRPGSEVFSSYWSFRMIS